MVLRFSWRILVVVLALVLLAGAAYTYYQQYVRVDPQALLQEAVGNTLREVSYRYRIEIVKGSGSAAEVLSRVQGERAGERQYHIQGEILNQKVDVYQLGDTTYLKDWGTGRWAVLAGNDLLDQALFMVEIAPLSSFNFTQVDNLQYGGRVKEQGKRLHLLQFDPAVENEFLEMWFKDYHYRLWVNERERRITRAEMEAVTRANPAVQVSMRVEVYDYGAQIQLAPPVKEAEQKR